MLFNEQVALLLDSSALREEVARLRAQRRRARGAGSGSSGKSHRGWEAAPWHSEELRLLLEWLAEIAIGAGLAVKSFGSGFADGYLLCFLVGMRTTAAPQGPLYVKRSKVDMLGLPSYARF